MPRPYLFSLFMLSSPRLGLKIPWKVPPDLCLSGKISQKDLSVTVNFSLNSFLRRKCPESFHNFKSCNTKDREEGERKVRKPGKFFV